MGRLSTLTILLTLGAWGAATDGAPPDDAAPPASPSAHPTLPAPVADYLKGGVYLFKQGDHAQAAQYLKVAQDHRGQLSPQDQTTLDEYQRLVSQTQAGDTAKTVVSDAANVASAVETSARDTASGLLAQARQAAAMGRPDEARRLASQADAMGVSYGAAEDSPGRLLAELDAQASGTEIRGNATRDDKQAARWKLQQARERIALGQYDEAEALIAEAGAMNIRWGLFDDTPAKVSEALEKARPEVAAAPSEQPGTKEQARAKLKEARALIAAGRVEQAEAAALEVGSWGLHFGFLEDSPNKVVAAARAIRRRQSDRQQGNPLGGGAVDLYNVTVQEARALLNSGQFDQAEAKARQAQQMNVVPSLTADRAETVLHDIAMTRARAMHPVGTGLCHGGTRGERTAGTR